MSIEIPLTRGLVALVDDDDYAVVAGAGKWHANIGGNTFYARRALPGPHAVRRYVLMHNLLTGWSFVDHANGNGLDNRRSNLRPADRSKNSANSKLPHDSTTGYKGVSRHGWTAQIVTSGRQIHLGTFDTPEAAARAYDRAAVEHFGEFARLNFPSCPPVAHDRFVP